ncbi:hypothetical protein ACJX0J_030657, partial [Zea mays]
MDASSTLEDLLLLHPPVLNSYPKNDAQEMTIQILDKSEAQQSFNRSLPYRELMGCDKTLQELGALKEQVSGDCMNRVEDQSTVVSIILISLPLMFT